MPTFNDDAVYIGQMQTQFSSAWAESDNGQGGVQVVINWEFTVGASETFGAYDPSAGFVPAGFVLKGANFSPPASVVLSQVNVSSVSSSETTAALKIWGSETSGSAQACNIWAVYSTVPV